MRALIFVVKFVVHFNGTHDGPKNRLGTAKAEKRRCDATAINLLMCIMQHSQRRQLTRTTTTTCTVSQLGAKMWRGIYSKIVDSGEVFSERGGGQRRATTRSGQPRAGAAGQRQVTPFLLEPRAASCEACPVVRAALVFVVVACSTLKFHFSNVSVSVRVCVC